MSTPQVKAPTRKAFPSPNRVADKTEAPGKVDKNAGKKMHTTAAATPKTTKRPPAKAPAAKPAAKTSSVEAAAAKKTVESQPKSDAKPRRVKKEKVVRDSFTMPKSDYAKIATLKEKCQKNGVRVKKSELLRAALAMLDAAPEKRLVEAIKALETVKTGRPANA
jgi:hypothetical protein